MRTSLVDKTLPKQKVPVQGGVGLGPLSLLSPQYISFLPGIALNVFQETGLHRKKSLASLLRPKDKVYKTVAGLLGVPNHQAS